ncbi:alpha-L-fucosidase [Bacteroides xylanisolvens]|mgnify:CR=1 FL=1|uniref:alpha-L-fucosidase n=1 Tax=Bacteroides xylanisolvens TaxID=371601 RepID=UPI003512130D
MKHLSLLLSFIFLTSACSEKPHKEKYEANWESLKQYTVPEWWKDMKFGIYFHWGPYSVPAYKEWYSHWMYEDGNKIREYHEKTYGNLKDFGYKDFIPMFTAEKFNADEWAKLFKDAGAQFAGPVAEHSDGFAMWDSELTEWNSAKMGPKKDIVKLMADAVRKQGMKYIITYHRHWLYAWYPTWDKSTDAGDPKYAGLYGPYVPKGSFKMGEKVPTAYPDDKFNQEWLDRLNELMDKYEPDIIWFDNKMNIIGEKYRMLFLANFYNNAEKWGKEVVCTYKAKDMAEGSAVLDLERSRMSEMKPFPWLTDDSIDWDSWCYIDAARYKTTNRLIDFLVDVVSKNGAVLLNINPKANGEIPSETKERLLQMGQWLKLNGEAIYGTRTWNVYGEGPQKIVEGHLSEFKNSEAVAQDIRFTQKNGQLYAIALDWPEDGKLTIKTLKKGNPYINNFESVSMLGCNDNLEFNQSDEGLVVTFPTEKPCDYAFVLKIN